MIPPPAVSHPVAIALVRKYLAALRGYNPIGDARFGEVVQAVCVSVEHVEATLSHFEEECPTPREIKDVALNLRDRFLPPHPSLKEQWEKEYGPPDPKWSERLIKPVTGPIDKKAWEAQKREMLLQAIRDTLWYTEGPGRYELDNIVGKQQRSQDKLFWDQQLARFKQHHPEELAAIRAAGIVLLGGVVISVSEPEFPKPAPVPTPQLITAEDFAKVKPMAHETCTVCGGSGRLAGDDYCTCRMGIDLRRLEAS